MSAPTQEMAALNLTYTIPALPHLVNGKKGAPKTVTTNTYPVTMKPNVPFYLYDFRCNAVFIARDGQEKLMEITKQSRDDLEEQTRKKATMIAYEAMKAIGALKGDFCPDRAALLIGIKEIPQCANGAVFTTSLTRQNAPKLFTLAKIHEAREVRVAIKKASESYQVSSNDLQSEDDSARRTILNAINLASSQGLFENTGEFRVYGNGNGYLLHPENHGFSGFDAGTRDKQGGVGLTKGARLIEGPNGTNAAGVTVDVKKTVFHKKGQTVHEKLVDLGCLRNQAEATHCLAGIKAQVIYAGAPKEQKANPKSIVMGIMGHEQVRNVTFDLNGKRTSLINYILTKYKTKIMFPDDCVIIDKYDGNMYAPETLVIPADIRVKNENIQPANIEKIIRASATLPEVRKAETETLARAMNAGANNPAQVRRNVVVGDQPLQAVSRVLEPIRMGTGENGPKLISGPWKQGTIAQKPLDRMNRWSVVNLQDNYSSGDLAQETATAIMRWARGIGYDIKMELSTINEPAQVRDNTESQLDAIFAREKAAGSQFIMVIGSPRIKNHAIIKQLEIRHDVITQQLTTPVAQKITHQGNTGTNVCLKVVEKLGGQNHFIARITPDLPTWITAKGTLLVGLQMLHPSAMTGKEKESNAMPSRPVCIGWSYNGVRGAVQRGATDQQLEKEATHFSCDWTYAMPKDYNDGKEFYASYKAVVLSILRSFKKYRDCIPARIILYRGGVAEGDYPKIRSEEHPIWWSAFKELATGYDPTFIIMTVNTQHSDRFYQEKINSNGKAPQQNLPSGSVIDSVVTNPNLSQAFLQAHVPLQGTAKLPSIVVQHVFLNEKQKMAPITMDDVIRTTHALCYAHGVCNTPTALPTPLYVAQESMKRATELLASYQRRSGARGGFDLDQIKKELTLNPETSAIHGLRVNA